MGRFISYWMLPAIAGVVWLTTLLALLLYWVVNTNMRFYPSMQAGATIAFISDIGAAELKPLFVTGCVVTTVFLDLGFGFDRWLRHKGRLVPNTTRKEKALKVLSIVFAVIGTAGLILLSIFDTARHPGPHRIFLLLFILGYLVSAVFICWEYRLLGKANRDHRILRISFWLKLAFIVVEFVLAVVFVVVLFSVSVNDVAAVFEWVIAFIFSFYIFSFVLDLYPAVRTRDTAPTKRLFSRNPTEMKQAEEGTMGRGRRGMGVGARQNGNSGNDNLSRPTAVAMDGRQNWMERRLDRF